jgi:hypothetical protein
VRQAWGPLSPRLVADCWRQLEQLLKAPAAEAWLADLHQARPATRELYRDAEHGFVLLAHAEHAGLYRPPHDHGRGWVLYGIQQGVVEMGSYTRMPGPDGAPTLVQSGRTILRAGDVQAYLPGEIHDTRCLSGTALLFRFTERDLKVEDRVEGRVTRYVDRDGVWAPAAP